MVRPFRNILSLQRRRRVSIAQGVSLLIVMAVALGHAQYVQASCGDWLDDPARHSEVAETAHPDGLEPIDLPCPCRGPMCEDGSRGDQPLPAPDVELSAQREFATLRECPSDDPRACGWNRISGRAAEQDGFPTPIDRPPRVV